MTVEGLIAAVLLGVAIVVRFGARQFLENGVWLSEMLVRRAVRRLPPEKRELMASVWLAELEYIRSRRSKLAVILWATAVYARSSQLADVLGDGEEEEDEAAPAIIPVLPTAILPTPPPVSPQVVTVPTMLSRSAISPSTRWLAIDGEVSGNIVINDPVVIEPSARLTGGVTCTTLVVLGKLVGDACATNGIVICDGGSVDGDIRAPRVTIRECACFRGSIDMQRKGFSPPIAPGIEQVPNFGKWRFPIEVPPQLTDIPSQEVQSVAAPKRPEGIAEPALRKTAPVERKSARVVKALLELHRENQ